MKTIIIILTAMLITCVIFIFEHLSKLEKTVNEIKDLDHAKNIVYKKMLDEYTKMMTAIDLNNHCMHDLNVEYDYIKKFFSATSEYFVTLNESYKNNLEASKDILQVSKILVDQYEEQSSRYDSIMTSISALSVPKKTTRKKTTNTEEKGE
jgi:hypothetical protein